MSPAEAFAALEKKGTAKLRELYAKQGAPNAFGVTPAGFKRLVQQMGRDHALAAVLWDSANADAMMLACMIADPGVIDDKQLQQWASKITFYKVADTFVDVLVVHVPSHKNVLEKWLTSKNEYIRRCGYRVLTRLAETDRSFSNEQWIAHLHRIMNELQMQENWARDAMNTALIAIGKINKIVHMEALIVAMQVGKVYVDYGDPTVKCPEAMSTLAQKKLRDSLK